MFSFIGFAYVVLSTFANSQEVWGHYDVTIDPKIIRGSRVMRNDHPHMVGLSKDNRHRKLFCGGSIIGRQTVLTAAHCIDFVFFEGTLDSSLLVMVGSNTWKKCNIYTVSHNITHPKYMPEHIKNDIALLITSEEITFSDRVSPILLDYDFQDGQVPARVAGWGMTEYGTYSNILMELTLETITGEECLDTIQKASYRELMSVDPKIEICTRPLPGRGTCMVDSGSPLVRTDTHAQIGIVSWGLPCAKGAPDVYVKISAFKDWIADNIV